MAIEYSYEEGQIKLHTTDSRKKRCWYLLIVTLIALIGLSTWLFVRGYFVPVNSDSPQAISLRGKMNEQAHKLSVQSEKLEKLETALGIARREKEIQKNANEELNKKLLLAEKKLSEAEEELLLYGNILSAKDLEPGLRIQHFTLKKVTVDKDGKKLPSSRLYRYYLVLSNIRKDDTESVNGQFEIKFIGTQGDQSTILKHKDLSIKEEGGGTPLTGFDLKYYQSLEDVVELPEGFKVKKVLLNVNPKSGKAMSQTHQWKKLLGDNK